MACGDYSTSNKEGDIFLSNIWQLLFNVEKEDTKIGKMKQGLTVRKVLSDYMSYFINFAIEGLKDDPEFKASGYFVKNFNIENIRYCFVCPNSVQELIKKCFVDAKILQKHEIKLRLSFVTEVEAIAYHLIALKRQTTKLVPNQTYILCNVSEITFGLVEISVDTTESLSKVVLLFESLKYGAIALEVKFREYLEDNSVFLNLNPPIIDALITAFTRDIKVMYGFYLLLLQVPFSEHVIFFFHLIIIKYNFNMNTPKAKAFQSILDVDKNPIKISHGDLNQAMFLPFIEYLSQRYSSLDNRKLILSGKYSCDPYFIDTLMYDSDKSFLEYVVKFDKLSTLASSGAVSFATRVQQVQIPFCNDINEDQPYKKAEIKMEEDYDFLVGIG